jgi:hypothetical protein
MQLKKRKIAQQLGFAAIGVTFALSATADTFTASVSTIDDVSITEVAALDFGTTVFTTAGNCIMDASAPGALLMEHTTTTGVGAQDAGYGATTGTSCVNVAGSDATVTPGVYRISGATGATVSLLVSQIAQGSADYTFNPDQGCYVDFSGEDTDDADSCVTLAPGTVYTTDLADVAGTENDDSGVGNGVAAPAGDLLFTVGGTLTVVNPLTAETNYQLDFQVDVTY